jgi:hypothetical protein
MDTFHGQIPSNFMQMTVRMATGVRIRFATRATRLEVRLRVHPVEVVGFGKSSAAIDLVEGTEIKSLAIGGGAARIDVADDTLSVLESPVESVVFEDLGGAQEIKEIWLPHNALWRSWASRRMLRSRLCHWSLHAGSTMAHPSVSA